MSLCDKCGHENPVGARFCSSCGNALGTHMDERTQGFDPIIDPNAEPPRADAYLVSTTGHRSGTRFGLHGQLVTAGRHPESDIFLDDITVSRRHVELTRSPNGHVVRDVGSLNGTYLNGNRIDEAPLVPGDEVQIGKFKLMYLGADGQSH